MFVCRYLCLCVERDVFVEVCVEVWRREEREREVCVDNVCGERCVCL